jgi:hypothetical protein
MKKLISVILMAAMLFGFAACDSGVSKDSIEPAVYRMEGETFPQLSLRKDGTFSLAHNAMRIGSTTGTYTVEEGVLKLITNDGSAYCFNIKKDALKFDADISDEFDASVQEEGAEIVDGTKFELLRTYENS